jgi:ABC-type sugar transport system substrate-binding protein
MRRWVPREKMILGLLVATAALAGCDSDSFVPPPKSGKKAATAISPSTPQRGREIVLILPAEDNLDLQIYEAVCRIEAGNLKVIYNQVRPAPSDPKSKQGELIKQAVEGGAAALLVVPDSSNETVLALAAVDQKKTPIVLLGRSVESPSSGPPYTLVTFPNFAASAKKVVEILAEDAKKEGASAGAPVLFLKDATADESSAEREAALNDALKAAKIPVAKTIIVTDTPADSQKFIEAALKDDPKICAVVADDDSGMSFGGTIRREFRPKTAFPIGGYSQPRGSSSPISLGLVSVAAERNVEGLARKAIRTALDRADGKTVPERVEIEIPIRRARTNPGTAPPPSPVSAQPKVQQPPAKP